MKKIYLINKLLNKIGIEIRKIKYPKIDYLFEIVFSVLKSKGEKESLNVIQVGANDGVTNDPIYRHVTGLATRILLIEPQPQMLEKLEEAYKNYNGELIIENVAISKNDSKVYLYTIKKEYENTYRKKSGNNPTGVASFDIKHIQKSVNKFMNIDGSIDKYINKVNVKTTSLANLINKYDFETVDLLQIDAEGYDWEVIQTLGNNIPNVINFEIKNLSKINLSKCIEWLEYHNYGYIRHKGDCIAIQHLKVKSV